MALPGIPIPLESFSDFQREEIMKAIYKHGISNRQWLLVRIHESGERSRFLFVVDGNERIPFRFEAPCTGVYNMELESCQDCSYARSRTCPHVTIIKEGAKAEDGAIHMVEFER